MSTPSIQDAFTLLTTAASQFLGTPNLTPNGSTSLKRAQGLCDYCHKRPKHFNGHQTHQFCSKACAQKAQGRRPTRSSPNTGCLLCGKATKQSRNFCSKLCSNAVARKAPMVLEVPAGHPTFTNVAGQFSASWRHPTTCPTVRKVYKVIIAENSLLKYEAYRDAVEARGHFVAAGMSAGNENRRWHGTTRDCSLGDPGHSTLCSSPNCSLCSIIRTSYKINLWGKKTGWGRFGVGIYTSSTASKSNDYAHNNKSSKLKALLLNKVVVGKGCKMINDNTKLIAPPLGYDSVLAEVSQSGSLNYDELVCYTNEAVRPSYLVMYDA